MRTLKFRLYGREALYAAYQDGEMVKLPAGSLKYSSAYPRSFREDNKLLDRLPLAYYDCEVSWEGECSDPKDWRSVFSWSPQECPECRWYSFVERDGVDGWRYRCSACGCGLPTDAQGRTPSERAKEQMLNEVSRLQAEILQRQERVAELQMALSALA